MTDVTVEDLVLENQRATARLDDFADEAQKGLAATKAALGDNYYELTVDEAAIESATVFNTLKSALAALSYGAYGKITLKNSVEIDSIHNFKAFRGSIVGDGQQSITAILVESDSGNYPAYAINFLGLLTNITLNTCKYDRNEAANSGSDHAFFRNSYLTTAHFTSSTVNLADQYLIESTGNPVALTSNKLGSGLDITLDELATANHTHVLLQLLGSASATVSLANYSVPDGVKAEDLILGAKLDVNNVPLNLTTNLDEWV